MLHEYVIPLLIAFAVLIYATIMAAMENKRRVPAAVYEAFYKAYPQARDVTFEKDRQAGTAVIEVEFDNQGVRTEATYTRDGLLLEIEEDIKPDQLPETIVEALRTAYPYATLTEAEKITKTDGTVSGYEVELKQELEIHLDASGKILNTKAD